MDDIDAGLWMPDIDFHVPTFPSGPSSTSASASSSTAKKRRSTRRTTMLTNELQQSLNRVSDPAQMNSSWEEFKLHLGGATGPG